MTIYQLVLDGIFTTRTVDRLDPVIRLPIKPQIRKAGATFALRATTEMREYRLDRAVDGAAYYVSVEPTPPSSPA